MQRSPPATRRATDRLEAKLKEQVKTYRKHLQKISRLKTKILGALRDKGCREAAELLQMPAKEPGATRCSKCVGCRTLASEGPCHGCLACQGNTECEEHTRLCMTWSQPATTFVAGSVSTGVSSLCNVIDYDLAKYKELMDKLGDASLEVEAVLNEFPVGSDKHVNDRFNASRRTRDIEVEEDQFATIEMLLNRYQEHRVRLRDVLGSDDEDEDDAIDVGRSVPAPFGLLTQTNTLHQFNSPAPEGRPVDHGPPALPAGRRARRCTGVGSGVQPGRFGSAR